MDILPSFHKKEGNVTNTLTIFQRDLEAWVEKLNGKKSDW